MSFAETKWGGFAKIIVDTSTMTVGDTVRVKSVTTGTNYDKQVVTVGTPLIWETEIYKDYVKICMVQTINDTPTEIGGVYREVDYGQTLFINVLDKTTLGGIQGILNAHQETSLLNIGDEVDITVNGSLWTMQIADINTYHPHSVILASKDLWKVRTLNEQYSYTTLLYANTDTYAEMESFYNNMAEKAYVKELRKTSMSSVSGTGNSFYAFDAHVWIPNCYEVQAQYQDSANPKKQFSLFTTQANRRKTYNDMQNDWWTCDGWYAQYAYRNFCYINANGSGIGNAQVNNTKGLLPCFEMVADS